MGDLAEDRISLVGMRFFGRHGVHPFERELGQPFEADVEVETDLAPAGASDDLDRTVDYCRIYEIARDVIEGPSRRLMESLAEDVSRRVLALPGVEAVTVRLRKPRAQLPGTGGVVQVEVRRRL